VVHALLGALVQVERYAIVGRCMHCMILGA